MSDTSFIKGLRDRIAELEKENKRLKELEAKIEEIKFDLKARTETIKPKTAREAENLIRAKHTFEEMYSKELRCLEKENKKLKEEIEYLKFGWVEDFYSK